jgi:hypothetical protein
MTYSNQPQGLFALLKNCFTAYPKVLKNIWYLVLISSLLNVVSGYVVKWNLYVGTTVAVLGFLAIVFIFAVILHTGNTVLSGAKPDLRTSMKNARRCYLRLLGGYLVLFGLFLIVALIDFGVISLSEIAVLSTFTPLFYTVAVIFSLFVFFLTYFILPIIVLEHQPVFKSLDMSVKWVWQYKWPINGVLLGIIVLVVAVIFTGIRLLPVHNVLIMDAWNFISQFFMYPLLMTTILVLLNDMKVRQRLQK